MLWPLRVLLLFSLLLCSLRVTAQVDTTTVSFPRWYGSIQYGRQNYQLLRPAPMEPWRTNQRRIQFSLGYQASPQWALQVGWGPARYDMSDTGIGTNMLGQPTSEIGWGKDRSHTFSTIARYTPAKRLFSKFQWELLAGTVLLWNRNWGETTRTENGEIVFQRQTDTRFTNVYALAGPAVSYPFGRHFQTTAELTFNKSFKGTLEQYNVSTTGNRLGISRSFILGVRYRFLYK